MCLCGRRGKENHKWSWAWRREEWGEGVWGFVFISHYPALLWLISIKLFSPKLSGLPMTVIGEWFFLSLSLSLFSLPCLSEEEPTEGTLVGIWHPARASPPQSDKCQVFISVFLGSFHFSAKSALTIKLKWLDLYCCNIPQTNFRKWKSPKPLLSLQINSTDKFNKYS